MTRRGSAVLAVLTLLGVATRTSSAQDTVATVLPPIRHILGLAFAQVQPFARSYDVSVLSGDTTVHLGRRDVTLSEAFLSDSSSGWLLTERRDGVVPGVDSVWLALDLRPVRWTALVASAHLELTFDNDSLRGFGRGPRGGTFTIAEACPPDLVLSGAMVELFVGLLPLSAGWADSVHMLSADMSGADVTVAELLVMGEDSVAVAGASSRRAWLVGLHADARQLALWVDEQSGAVIKSQQTVSPHTGTVLEYRERSTATRVFPPE